MLVFLQVQASDLKLNTMPVHRTVYLASTPQEQALSSPLLHKTRGHQLATLANSKSLANSGTS